LPIRPLRMTSVAQAEARALGSGQLVQGLITGSRRLDLPKLNDARTACEGASSLSCAGNRPFVTDCSWPGLPVRDAGRELPPSNLAITPKDCCRASPRTQRLGHNRVFAAGCFRVVPYWVEQATSADLVSQRGRVQAPDRGERGHFSIAMRTRLAYISSTHPLTSTHLGTPGDLRPQSTTSIPSDYGASASKRPADPRTNEGGISRGAPSKRARAS
jgi:hypothetical protein